MSPIVAADLETQLAELARVTDPAPEPLGYGRDLSCVTDCTSDFLELEETDTARIVAQAVCRRFITPRGGLLDEPDYGCDLRAECNRGLTQTELRTLQSRMRSEAMKDERVESATVQLSAAAAGDVTTLSARVVITPRDAAVTPFAFVVSITSTQTLLDLQGA